MSLIKILKWIGPSIDHRPTPDGLEFGLEMILSIFIELQLLLDTPISNMQVIPTIVNG